MRGAIEEESHMTGPATLMEYGWSFLDARMSNPADYEMMIGSNFVESGMI